MMLNRSSYHLLKAALIAAFTIAASNSSVGQPKDQVQGRPKSIMESFPHFDRLMDDTSKYTFFILPEDVATMRLHHGLGTRIRNNWGLWANSSLKQELRDSGFVHPDDMSSALLHAYHRKLHGKDLRIGEMALAYQTYWNRINENDDPITPRIDMFIPTPQKDLLKYYPVGDTIVVYLYATKKGVFQQFASGVSGIAVVRSHTEEDLMVELLHIYSKERHEPEKHLGDEFEVSPLNCGMIPPAGWSSGMME